MELPDVTAIILDVLLLPLQLIMVPIDSLLAQIPGIGQIPSYIASFFSFIGNMPATVVRLTGIAPAIWNTALLVFLLFFTLSPSINVAKKIWAWVRP